MVATPMPTGQALAPRTDRDLLSAYDALLERYAPPGLLVDEHRQLLHVFGDAGDFLGVTSGRPAQHIGQLVVPGLRVTLEAALTRAFRDGGCVEFTSEPRGKPVQVSVEPLSPRERPRRALVTFGEAPVLPAKPAALAPEPDTAAQDRVAQLERELAWARETLQATCESAEAASEELQATNEELVAANEELQSTNEELQSVNEELYTVNDEYQKKNTELTELSDDLNHLVDSTRFGVVFLDRNLTVRRFTPEATRIFNLLPQDVGRPLDHITTGLLDERVCDDARSVLAGGRSAEREVHHQDGRSLLMQIRPYVRATGLIDGAVLSFVDISALKNVQDVLASTQVILSNVIDLAPIAVLYVQSDYRIAWLNSESAAQLGGTVDELLGQNLMVKVPGVRPRRPVYERVLAGESLDMTATPMGGKLYNVGYRPTQDPDGTVHGFVVIAQDVTAHLENERVRQEHAAMLQQLPIGVLLCREQDGCLGVVAANPAASTLLETTADIGAPLDAWLPEPWKPDVAPLLARAYEGDRADALMTARHRRIRVATVPVPPSGLAVLIEDATDTELARQRRDAALRLESIGQVAGGVAHELNNLLAVILMSVDGVQHEEDATEDLENIKAAGQRAADLVTQLLAFSKRRPVTPEPVHLGTLVVELSPILRRILGVNIALETRIDDVGCVRIDRAALEQVLLNLTNNARAALPDGGTVHVRTSCTDEAVVLAFTDDGAGMDSATLERCFEPFYTTNKDGLGTGLGLSLCHGVVTQAGGTIVADSDAGQGACFTLTFPQTSAEVAQPSTEPTTDAGGTETILLVEDVEPLRAMVSRHLRRRGYTVLEAERGDAALEYATECIDLLLSDVVMPEMNGPALAEALRVEHPGLPVIFMSGYPDHAGLRTNVRDLNDPLITKPFAIADLCLLVRKTLDERRPGPDRAAGP